MTSAFMQLRPGEVTVHPPQQFYAGDTWPISAVCTDGDGATLDLSAAEVEWVLNDIAADGVSDGVNKLTLSVGAGIALVENTSGDLVPGLILITVTPSQSAPLPVGFYRDQLQVSIGGQVFTQFRGRIEVLAKLHQAVSGN